ncbi:hypothetical protein AVEN_254697-1 [Araneus ventricosus]|uniref:Uncharacterized protein n=1 Tax=Araneus ventricosus TaxID=182803 RepID=A0A4Y2T1U9_ARAVE|nr:hypothetical protein AVEN_60850-1 [Araneus ventricosus]GBN94589.1 hypothetical protein AVEN_254697-1 [Araneus ventricosus]
MWPWCTRIGAGIKPPPASVVWKFRMEVQAWVSPSSSDHGSRGSSQNSHRLVSKQINSDFLQLRLQICAAGKERNPHRPILPERLSECRKGKEPTLTRPTRKGYQSVGKTLRPKTEDPNCCTHIPGVREGPARGTRNQICQWRSKKT